MHIIEKPFLDRSPEIANRDPAVILERETFHCFFTAVEATRDGYRLFLEQTMSRDLIAWEPPIRLTDSSLNFSSPGNVIRHEDRWILVLQSYPIDPGKSYANEDARIWLMESSDLIKWSQPRQLNPRGCQCNWTRSHRQIDPFLIQHLERFWCFYKTDGQLGLLQSEDLIEWRESSPDRPVLCSKDTPDGSTLENPCVVNTGNEFVLFFSPCRAGRGIGTARSTDLCNWTNIHYLNFPELPWACGGPTAAMVLDTRKSMGCWTMFFHGDREGPHGAALGLAFSEDLENWSQSRSRI